MSEEKKVPRLDRVDVVALLGLLLLLLGIAWLSKPLALIALGLVLFLWAWVSSSTKKDGGKGE